MNTDAKARNEEFFRQVNEQIEAISQTIPASEPTMEFLCECDDLTCQGKVEATRSEYESARAVPTHFIVLPEHVDTGVEHVVSSNDRFVVVEKEGAAASDAEAHNPRDNAEGSKP
jgi:hypothetical protein